VSSVANDIAARKRSALLRGGLVFGIFILYPVLAMLTPVLDGTVAGVSVAYVVGFLQIMLGLVVTLLHVRRHA
jgi:uncharacterized membrane protein (DUF485 family)